MREYTRMIDLQYTHTPYARIHRVIRSPKNRALRFSSAILAPIPRTAVLYGVSLEQYEERSYAVAS